MPNKKGWLTKEEVLETGLPFYTSKDNIAGWSSKTNAFAIVISKSRCQHFKCPIAPDEKPVAYRYIAPPGDKFRFVPLYDRTAAFHNGKIERKQLVDHEIMESVLNTI